MDNNFIMEVCINQQEEEHITKKKGHIAIKQEEHIAIIQEEHIAITQEGRIVTILVQV